MTSNALEIPDQLLVVLAKIMERMAGAASVCRSNTQVLRAVPSCYVARYRDPEEQPFTAFESYVEVETQADRSITWYLEIWATKEKWLVLRSICENVAPTQETLVEFPDEEFRSFSDFLERIDLLTKELTDMSAEFQF